MNVYPIVILLHVFIHILKKKIFFSFCNNLYKKKLTYKNICTDTESLVNKNGNSNTVSVLCSVSDKTIENARKLHCLLYLCQECCFI